MTSTTDVYWALDAQNDTKHSKTSFYHWSLPLNQNIVTNGWPYRLQLGYQTACLKNSNSGDHWADPMGCQINNKS